MSALRRLSPTLELVPSPAVGAASEPAGLGHGSRRGATFTVADVLRLETLRAGEARVLTGDDGLDAPVRWVHSSEISDIARFLRGGEMLLTAGLGIGSTDGQQRAYVRGIAAAGAAALVIEESGRAFHRVPRTVVDEGIRCGLPVIALTHEVPFAAVSAEVHDVLTEQQLQTIKREREIETLFSTQLLDGGDHVGVVQTLAGLVGGTVVLEDVNHRIAVCEAAGGVFDAASWERHARVLHGSHTECVRRPVLARGQLWGNLHVLNGRSADVDFSTDVVTERAATAIAIALLTDRSREAIDDQRSTALLTHLMLGELSGPEFVEQAAHLGYQLGGADLFVAVGNKAGDAVARDPNQTRIPLGPNAISADMGDYVITVAPRAGRARFETAARADDGFLGGGCSRDLPADRIGLAVRQAKSAAAVARTTRRWLNFDELGVERILVGLADGPELAAFVEDELGPLLSADAASHTPLLPTLRAFLEHDGRKTDAADALYIQRRTLYNRLERMAGILGRSLDDADTRQRLTLAVKALDLMQG